MKVIKDYEIRFEVKVLSDLPQLRKLLEANNMLKPNFSELARNLKKSRNTVKRNYYLGDQKKRRKKRVSQITDYHDRIEKLLVSDIKRFNYIQHLYNYMVQTYDLKASYATFRRYVQLNFNEQFKANKQYTTGPRFETAPAIQAQLDFKEDVKVVTSDGEVKSVTIATLIYGYSRWRFRAILPDKTTDSMIHFLALAFDDAGGFVKELVIDNPKSLVTTARTRKKEAVLNTTFEAFAKDYGIIVRPCLAMRPETKGKVETSMKELDELTAYNGEYTDIASISEMVQVITRRANQKISQATNVPPAMLYEKEKEQLLPLPPDSTCSQYKMKFTTVKSTLDSLIKYKNCFYAVPSFYKSKELELRIYKDMLQIYYNTELIEIYQMQNKKLNYKAYLHLEHSLENMVSPSDEAIEQALENFKSLEEVQHG